MYFLKLRYLTALIFSIVCISNTANAQPAEDESDSDIYLVMSSAFIDSCTSTYPELEPETIAFWQIVKEAEQRKGKREGVIRATVKEARAQCGNQQVSLTKDLCRLFIQTVTGSTPELTTQQEEALSQALNTEIPALFNCDEAEK